MGTCCLVSLPTLSSVSAELSIYWYAAPWQVSHIDVQLSTPYSLQGKQASPRGPWVSGDFPMIHGLKCTWVISLRGSNGSLRYTLPSPSAFPPDQATLLVKRGREKEKNKHLLVRVLLMLPGPHASDRALLAFRTILPLQIFRIIAWSFSLLFQQVFFCVLGYFCLFPWEGVVQMSASSAIFPSSSSAEYFKP